MYLPVRTSWLATNDVTILSDLRCYSIINNSIRFLRKEKVIHNGCGIVVTKSISYINNGVYIKL